MSSAPGRRRSPKRLCQHFDGRGDVVQRQGRLADHGERLAAGLERACLLGGLDHDDLVRALALRAYHLDVVAVADERDEMAAVGIAPRLGVHLRNQGADGVDDA